MGYPVLRTSIDAGQCQGDIQAKNRFKVFLCALSAPMEYFLCVPNSTQINIIRRNEMKIMHCE